MTRAVSVGRSSHKGLFAKFTLGALGSVLVTMSLSGCPGTLQGDFPPPSGGSAGSSGGTAGAGTAGSGSAGAMGTAGAGVSLSLNGGGCDISVLVTKYKCTMGGGLCHDSMGSGANFDMTTTGWQNKLVGGNPKTGTAAVASVCVGKGPYIIKGSPTGDGLFIQKISDATPPCGAQMPFVMTAATSDDIACFRKWTTYAANAN